MLETAFITVGSKFLRKRLQAASKSEPAARLSCGPRVTGKPCGPPSLRAVRTHLALKEDSLTGLAAPTPLTFFQELLRRKFSSESLVGYEARIPKPGWGPSSTWTLPAF